MELGFKEAPMKFSVFLSNHPVTLATLSSSLSTWHWNHQNLQAKGVCHPCLDNLSHGVFWRQTQQSRLGCWVWALFWITSLRSEFFPYQHVWCFLPSCVLAFCPYSLILPSHAGSQRCARRSYRCRACAHGVIRASRRTESVWIQLHASKIPEDNDIVCNSPVPAAMASDGKQ